MSLQFPIPFTKMSGTGNDFIIIDHRRPILNGIDLAAFTRAVCRRKFSVGADGLILIEESTKADFSWQFFNGDGSVAEMCGNGARCAARFAYEQKIAPAMMRFATLAGIIEAIVNTENHGSVKIRLTPPEDIVLNRSLAVGGTMRTLHSINTGVPHAVLLVDDVQAVPVVDWGRPVRHHDLFKPAGTNVNFVQKLPDNALHVRTYERGVENETMACGTGAVAAAIVAALVGIVKPPVQVTTSGGEHLAVYFILPENEGNAAAGAITEVYLEGPANLVYEGSLEADSLQSRF
jgi:diaminopimelate epimerase